MKLLYLKIINLSFNQNYFLTNLSEMSYKEKNYKSKYILYKTKYLDLLAGHNEPCALNPDNNKFCRKSKTWDHVHCERLDGRCRKIKNSQKPKTIFIEVEKLNGESFGWS